jgi:adenylate kinase family enzyme
VPDLARIAVIGTSCSGKSTLAARLASSLEASLIELDEIHWGPGWSTDPPDVFRAKVEGALEAERWVCAGNYSIVHDLVWQRATALVWIDLPFWPTFGRAVSRTFLRTMTRAPVCGDNREPWLGFLDPEWIPYWVIRTWRRNRTRFAARIAAREFEPLDVFVLRSRAEVERFAEQPSAAARSRDRLVRGARTRVAST